MIDYLWLALVIVLALNLPLAAYIGYQHGLNTAHQRRVRRQSTLSRAAHMAGYATWDEWMLAMQPITNAPPAGQTEQTEQGARNE
ncbi:MAG TPA: hypothetical protein VMV29_14740 [Ktedonobacterales bacterium]|nr:hypothetical protein [Ktedonobacterales bacterium]